MAMHYSDPTRASDPHALPDVETFRAMICTDCGEPANTGEHSLDCEAPHYAERFFWQSCFPGCLPDSDPIGPFATEAEALADARESIEAFSEGCGVEGPDGYRCTHHDELSHLALGTEGNVCAHWPLADAQRGEG